MERCRQIDLAMSIQDAGVSLQSWVVGDKDDDADDLDNNLLEDTVSLASWIAPVSNKIFGTQWSLVNYFTAAERFKEGTHNY